jgi:MFS family permease
LLDNLLSNKCSDILFTDYGPTIYGNLGYNTEKQLLYQCGWQTVCWAGGVLAIFFVDLFRRPTLLIIGLFGSLTCLSILAALIVNYADSTNAPALNAAVAITFIYTLFVEGCLDGTQWTYLGELWPSHMRPKGIAMGSTGLTGMGLIFVLAAPQAFT